ncbi:hypothetical protein ACQ4PT_014271 [Festuca glaucescens]
MELRLGPRRPALGCIPPPSPAVPLLQIRFPKPRGRVPKKQLVDTDRVNSLLRAAARLDPEEFFLAFPWGLVHGLLLLDLPCFHRATSIEVQLDLYCTIRCVPAGVEFSALERLSLSNCTTDLDALLSRCPLLRTLRLTDVRFHNNVLSVNSPLLQELTVARGKFINHVNIVAPVLTQLTMFLKIFHTHSISVLAPMVEKFSWDCYLYGLHTTFGVWILMKLSLKTAEGQGQLSSLHMHASPSTNFYGETDNFEQQIVKHMIAAFSVLELHLTTKEHVYGAFVVHLLGINRIRCVMQRLKVNLRRPAEKEEGCLPHCRCDSLNWKSQTISLTSLEEVEITGFEGEDHEFDLLKLILRCAPILKRIIMKLSQEASASNDRCAKIYNIFRVYSSVECYIYLSSGLIHGSQNCTST